MDGSRFELLILDCDGVLVDSEPVSNRVFAEMLAELGLELSLEQMFAEFVGLSMDSCMKLVEARLGMPPPPDFADALRQRQAQALEKEVVAVAGIEAALDGIDLASCVASSGEHEKMRLTLGRTGLLPRFEGRIFSASEVARGKPAPDLFLHAAARMGVAPAHCVVVEDSAPGVRAAVAAGMAVLGFAARTPAERLAGAGARVFRCMSELPELVSGARWH